MARIESHPDRIPAAFLSINSLGSDDPEGIPSPKHYLPEYVFGTSPFIGLKERPIDKRFPAYYNATETHEGTRELGEQTEKDCNSRIGQIKKEEQITGAERIEAMHEMLPQLETTTEPFVQEYIKLLEEKRQTGYLEIAINAFSPPYMEQLRGNHPHPFKWEGIHSYAQRRAKETSNQLGDLEILYSPGVASLESNPFTSSFTTPRIEEEMKKDRGWSLIKGYLEYLFKEDLPNFKVDYNHEVSWSKIKAVSKDNITIIFGTKNNNYSAQQFIIYLEEAFEASMDWILMKTNQWTDKQITLSPNSKGIQEVLSGRVIDTFIMSDYLEKEGKFPPGEVALLREQYQQEYLTEKLSLYLLRGAWEADIIEAYMENPVQDSEYWNKRITGIYSSWREKVFPMIYESTPELRDNDWSWVSQARMLVHRRRFPFFLSSYTTRFLSIIGKPPTVEELQQLFKTMQQKGKGPHTPLEECLFFNDERQRKEFRENGMPMDWIENINNFFQQC